MRLPKEKILFVVDFLPVGSVPGRGMIDFYPLEAEQAIKQVLAMDWERLIPGHPGPGDRLGTKQDAQDQLTFLQDASAAVKVAAREGKCWEPAEKEVKLPKYEKWPGYENNLQFVTRRYCGPKRASAVFVSAADPARLPPCYCVPQPPYWWHRIPLGSVLGIPSRVRRSWFLPPTI